MAWPEAHPLPILEMNASLGLTAAAVLLLPFFLASAAFKVSFNFSLNLEEEKTK